MSTLHMYYAYYYSKITWEATIEHQGGHSRQCSRNIQLDIKYLGCSKGTPEEYIPQNEQDVHQTYPDIEGAWVKDPDSNNVDSNTGGSNSGNEDSSYNNDYSDSKQKDYLYVAHVICDSEKGDSDDLYIYKKNGGSEIRASWVYSSKGLDLAATEKVHYANKSVNGTYYKYYICPYGISFYFNY